MSDTMPVGVVEAQTDHSRPVSDTQSAAGICAGDKRLLVAGPEAMELANERWCADVKAKTADGSWVRGRNVRDGEMKDSKGQSTRIRSER